MKMPAAARIRNAVLIALLLAGSALVPAFGGGTTSKVRAAEGSLAPQWIEPVLTSLNQAHRETSIALSPTDPDLMAVCDPSGVPNTANGQSYFHRSRNGGWGWNFMDVENSPTDLRSYAFEGGDCDVAFDAAGTMYSADTWLGDLSVGHSTDGGTTWSGTPLAVTSPIVDRPWLVGGPAGTIHVSYQDLQCCTVSAIWYTRSTDSGQTFLPAVPVTTAREDGAFTWEGNFVVSKNGQDLYLVYTRRSGAALGSLDATGPEKVFVAASHDAGLTWESHLVANMPQPASYLYPSIAMDEAGWLHVVFASRRADDRPIWYSFSKDGNAWTNPVPLMDGASGYSPWIAAAGPGEAAITWYGSPTPMQSMSEPVDWYFYWARVSGADTGALEVTAGTTTEAPIFTGSSGIPEFEMVRLDKDGRMHIGMSAYRKKGGSASWSIYYQREILPMAAGSGSVLASTGEAAFAMDVRRDAEGAVAGTLTLDDPGAGVSIRAVSFDTLSIDQITGGLTCTVTGHAEVTRATSTITEPFTASCKDAASGDTFSIATPSYHDGGSLSGGDVTAG